jgi:hypothetical protein
MKDLNGRLFDGAKVDATAIPLAQTAPFITTSNRLKSICGPLFGPSIPHHFSDSGKRD